MLLSLIIAPSFARAEELAASHNLGGEWRYFPSRKAGESWLAWSRDRHDQVDISWIEEPVTEAVVTP